MMQNGGNYAKFKLVPPQPSTLWGENVGKIYSTWNPDDIKLPWPLVKMISEFRSRLCQYEVFGNAFQRKLVHYPPLSIISKKMHKFRYLGDYDYAYKAGLLDILVDVSYEFTQFYRSMALRLSMCRGAFPLAATGIKT